MGGDEVTIYIREERTKPLSQYVRLKNDIFVSNFKGLSLKQYRAVRLITCNKEHTQLCNTCQGMLKVIEEVLKSGFITLKSAFMMCSSGACYKARAARRKLLRIPMACLGVGDLRQGLYCF